MPPTNVEAELREIHTLLARSGALIEGIAEKLEEAKAERSALERRITELERQQTLESGEKAGAERAASKADKYIGYFFSAVGVISTLIGAAWALFIRGEK